MIQNKQEIIQLLLKYLEEQNHDKIQEFLEKYQPADIAEILKDMDAAERGKIFKLLDKGAAALVLDMLDIGTITSLLETLGPQYIAEILNEMSSDDAADLLGHFPEELRNTLLGLMQAEDAGEVQGLLEYDIESAGGIMTTEYVAIPKDITAGKAIEILRKTAPDAETIYYVYVVDSQNRLVGVISLRELIVADPDTLIEDIMHKKVISVSVDMDQEEVAEVVSKYDFLAVPVVDHDNRLVGIITVDDVIDVIYDEASEDIFRLGGSTELVDDYVGTRISRALKSRLPWLSVTMLEGIIAGQVLRGLENELRAVVALAFFIPLLTGMGGNVGTQSATVTVRGLATGDIDENNVLSVIFRELLTGVLLGIINGILVGSIAWVWQKNAVLGFIVGLAMVGNMTIAALMGALVPLTFKKVGIDPAVASAPFITASIDITGLLIYSTLARLFIGFLL
ncbi:MAG TPA: magnesium transporter [Peptococcaceae bacterium]|nr:MAG: Magnesium transporter [Clostridia bacterium 41_269]HBT20292.1 magnesium transporter [Peptococcaceae bacterium]